MRSDADVDRVRQLLCQSEKQGLEQVTIKYATATTTDAESIDDGGELKRMARNRVWLSVVVMGI